MPRVIDIVGCITSIYMIVNSTIENNIFDIILFSALLVVYLLELFKHKRKKSAWPNKKNNYEVLIWKK